MGLASLVSDAVPSKTFTPQEHLVELLRISQSQDVSMVLLNPSEKPFLVLMLLRENSIALRLQNKIAGLIIADEEQIPLWAGFLSRMTDLHVQSDGEPKSEGIVLVTTTSRLKEHVNSNPKLLSRMEIMILDNSHAFIKDAELKEIISKRTHCRIITFTSNLFNESNCSMQRIDCELQKFKAQFGTKVETACELMSLVRYMASPRHMIVEYKSPSDPSALAFEIAAIVNNLEDYLHDHQFSLEETYGEFYRELIDEISDPVVYPLQLIHDFLEILHTLGVWAAERAALLLLIKLDKLKTREKYERHYLILSALYTEMLRIRKICDDTFVELTDSEKLFQYSTPKLLKLKDILLKYKPEHIGTRKKKQEKANETDTSKESANEEEASALPKESVNAEEKKESENVTDKGDAKVVPVEKEVPFIPHRFRSNRYYTSYDDPNALCSIVFVQKKFTAKVIYHFLKDLARADDLFSFLTPQYSFTYDPDDDFGGEFRKQEEALRRFRMRECNILVSNSLLEVGVETVRCNLVIAFDEPNSFKDYVHYKVKGKGQNAWFLNFIENINTEEYIQKLAFFKIIEDRLLSYCKFRDDPNSDHVNADLLDPVLPKFKADDKSSSVLTWKSAILQLNRYCAKLPSDTFTRLTPLWTVHQVDSGYVCGIQLPINSPVKDIILGPVAPTSILAKRGAAFQACIKLYEAKELDDEMNPVGKDGMKRDSYFTAFDANEPRPGTTKRRQYYYKRIAECLKKGEARTYNLYSLNLQLNCPIPDEQNTRGRKIYPPEESKQTFGILVSGKVPSICPFPIYTRSGEVIVEISKIDEDLSLTEEEMDLVVKFHNFTFSQVLRLQKYPMIFDPSRSDCAVLVLPLTRTARELSIDWTFLRLIKDSGSLKLLAVPDDDRKDFEFVESKYEDAVIMPWYRNQDQPQYFYVAEICKHLSPQSGFPGQGFESFEAYYLNKYSIAIQNQKQPLLDVDHTSARLNFLTPRYVNRKGVALPTSSEETKRNKRENLEQKQILVPELCAIHPFPASLWRQTVCLPCILYRLNGLLIADELRRTVAVEIQLGVPFVPTSLKWPALNFGWTLADVLKNRSESPEGEKAVGSKSNKATSPEKSGVRKESIEEEKAEPENELNSLNEKIVSKLNEEGEKAKKKQLEIGTWSNEMAENINSDSESDYPSDLEDFELPDNLTFIGKDSIPLNANRTGKDWIQGIEPKSYRVGSPTNFDGYMDELEGLSCSDSDDDDNSNPRKVQPSPVMKQGNLRFEFRGDNMAEAVEDDEVVEKRADNLSRDKAAEARMVEEVGAWEWDATENEELAEGFKKDVESEVKMLTQEEGLLLGPDEDFKPTPDSKNTSNENGLPEDPLAELNGVNSEGHKSLQWEMFEELSHCQGRSCVTQKAEPPMEDFPITEKPRFSFDHQPDLGDHPGPSPSIILQALTMSNSNDAINLERLETIGDSFLKYAITSFLFCTNPSIHEGRLSHLRSKQVSNLNLYRLGKEKKLGECMIATKFEPHDNWLPPSYHVPRELEQALIESGVPASYWNMADLPGINNMNGDEISALVKEKSAMIRNASVADGVPIEELPSFIPYNLLTQHSIPDKSIADCVEALIGAYLISCGPRGALLFMSWLGIKVLPTEDGAASPGALPQPPSPLLFPMGRNLVGQLDHLLNGYDAFEEIIRYRFKDRSYLLQAFSHASYYPNRLTDCYQRLEFLGDAVLDYLITRHLFEDEKQHSPGALTDLRSALVNNTIFASLAVKYGFHKYFKHYSPGLQIVIDRFVKLQAENEYKVSEEYFLVEEDDEEEAEDVEVPKALGDIFESVAGAVYLDSGLSLDTVWRVYYHMMKNEIDLFSNNVPKSPIRELLELEPETAKFGKPEKLADGRRVRVTVEVFGKGTFRGIGRNYRIAKCTAAKCALRTLKKSEKPSA